MGSAEPKTLASSRGAVERQGENKRVGLKVGYVQLLEFRKARDLSVTCPC